MSLDEKAGVVRGVFEDLSMRDTAAASARFAMDAPFDFTRSRGPNKGMFYGREAIKKNWDRFLEMWDEWVSEPADFVDLGEDQVLFSIHGRMSGRDGIELNVQAAGIWRIRDGQIVEGTFYQSRDDALEAAGLAS